MAADHQPVVPGRIEVALDHILGWDTVSVGEDQLAASASECPERHGASLPKALIGLPSVDQGDGVPSGADVVDQLSGFVPRPIIGNDDLKCPCRLLACVAREDELEVVWVVVRRHDDARVEESRYRLRRGGLWAATGHGCPCYTKQRTHRHQLFGDVGETRTARQAIRRAKAPSREARAARAAPSKCRCSRSRSRFAVVGVGFVWRTDSSSTICAASRCSCKWLLETLVVWERLRATTCGE